MLQSLYLVTNFNILTNISFNIEKNIIMNNSRFSENSETKKSFIRMLELKYISYLEISKVFYSLYDVIPNLFKI